jgi:hypothetical protein
VVETREESDVISVGMQITVTCSAVSSVHVLSEVLVSELASELLWELLSSSSVRSSVSEVIVETRPSTPVMSSTLMLPVMSSKLWPIHDKVLIMSPMAPKRPLLLLELHPEDESPPRSEITDSTSLMTSSTLLRVSVLSPVGSAFQELMKGMRAMISEDTEDTLEVAATPVTVVVAGGTVIVSDDPGAVVAAVVVVPESTVVEVGAVVAPGVVSEEDTSVLVPSTGSSVEVVPSLGVV